MSKPRKTYSVEVTYATGWYTIVIDETRGFVLGYLARHRESPGPKLGMRVLDSTGRVVDTAPGSDKVSLGMIAGFPTAAQYERAGNAALEQARLINERDAQRAAQRAARRAARRSARRSARGEL